MNRSSMSLPKIKHDIFLVVILAFLNYWMFRIFNLSPVYGVIIASVTIATVLNNKSKAILIGGIIILALLQIYLTGYKDPGYLDNDGQRVQQERMQSYGLTYIDTVFGVIWLKPAHWIEENKAVIVLSRIEENLFETLDLSYYFFGGFPRNNPSDYEKFPFFLIVFFIVGIVKLIKSRNYFPVAVLFFIPVAVLSLIGVGGKYGAFSMIPFFVFLIYSGVKVAASNTSRKKIFYIFLVFSLLLVFYMQTRYV
jgi:hypothetical protein